MRKLVLAIAAVGSGLGALYVTGRKMTAAIETADWRDLAPMPRARFVQTRSGRVHYVDVGSGRPILLFHGSGRSISDWQEAVPFLAANHRVIAYDCYGFGRSERNPAFTYGYDLWVQQAFDVLDALGIERATDVGHSVGGMLAMLSAIRHPERVDHVVTVGSGIAIEPAQFLPLVPGIGEVMMARQTMFGPAISAANREELEAAYRVNGTRAALLQYARRQVTIDGLRGMGRLREGAPVPFLHVSGSLDTNISPEAARRLARMTGGSYVLIEGATHMLHAEKPKELADEIERFVGR